VAIGPFTTKTGIDDPGQIGVFIQPLLNAPLYEALFFEFNEGLVEIVEGRLVTSAQAAKPFLAGKLNVESKDMRGPVLEQVTGGVMAGAEVGGCETVLLRIVIVVRGGADRIGIGVTGYDIRLEFSGGPSSGQGDFTARHATPAGIHAHKAQSEHVGDGGDFTFIRSPLAKREFNEVFVILPEKSEVEESRKIASAGAFELEALLDGDLR